MNKKVYIFVIPLFRQDARFGSTTLTSMGSEELSGIGDFEEDGSLW